MSGHIIQFGTSRFLQAHVDLFVHEARVGGEAAGPITVVQASAATGHDHRVAAFGQPEGFPVRIRGLEGGLPVDRTVAVTSVARGLSARCHWGELVLLFATATDAVVSNMGERGYEVAAEDRRADLLGAPAAPRSFPAMLLALLAQRWRAGGAGISIFPCELVSGNGRTLKAIVLGLARDLGADAAFTHWLETRVLWADTLVDRIVSQALEPLGAVAEPYALWAIARQPGLEAPCTHPAILMVDALEPYERLKLHILNLGHTVMADLWWSSGRRADETVRGMLEDDEVATRLAAIYAREVIPGFAARGMAAEARSYLATTLERFKNPFLDHKIADIAQHHEAKVERRIDAFLAWRAAPGAIAATPQLDAIVARKGRPTEETP